MIEAQAYLAAIIDSSDDAIATIDLKGNITSWNPAAERIYGYRASEAIGRNIEIIIPQDRISEEAYILTNIAQGNRIDHFESVRRHKDGHLIDISVTLSPIKDAEGKIIGASKVARDVTELKQAERVNAYYKAIVASSNDAIISKDLNGYITSWNQAAERIFGYSADEIVGKHITTIIPPELHAEESNILAKLKNGQRIEHYRTERRHKNGKVVPVSLTVSPIFDSKGNIIGASKISRDISERLATEQALLELNRNKDAFLANLSHELRTPMNAVVGLANILHKASAITEREKGYLKTLKDNADIMLTLINDLLDYSKIESGRIEFESVDFVLADVVAQAISTLRIKADEKNLDLKVQYNSAMHRSYVGDPLRIQQIITNLVANAIKFTDRGSITLKVDGDDALGSGMTKIIVSDTGIGIPSDKIGEIFDKFVQAEVSVTRRFGGSGLGLSIVKALTEAMGGTVTVESKEGIGTTFTVLLPLRKSEMLAKNDNKPPRTPEPTLTKRVLLAEDYPANILVASIMLDQLGCKYDVAKNGREALQKFSDESYDIILMDIQMAELDGLEATRQIRQKEASEGRKYTPIIAMTAHIHDEYKKKCIAAGMNDFISKPIDPSELAEKMLRATA